MLWKNIDYEFDGEDSEEIFEYGELPKELKNKSNEIVPETLMDIFPNMDVSQNDGIVTQDGTILESIDEKQHERYLGEPDCVFLPGYIVSINSHTNEFNAPGYTYNKFVITTNLFDGFDTDCFCCRGFRHFYIVDAETNKVLFASEEDEFVSEYGFVGIDVEEFYVGIYDKFEEIDGLLDS